MLILHIRIVNFENRLSVKGAETKAIFLWLVIVLCLNDHTSNKKIFYTGGKYSNAVAPNPQAADRYRSEGCTEKIIK